MERPDIALVTGYIPLQGHPRSATEYGKLGENMFGNLKGDHYYIHPYYETIAETWLCKLIRTMKRDVTHSAADNPEKNTLAYHCIQHQKFGWLLKAWMANPKVKTLVWMDYGIGHVPGVTPAVVTEFMASVRHDDLAIPGCATREGLTINPWWPCWRFCGGLMVVPANKAYWLYKSVKETMRKQIKTTNNIEWEVNTLARAEPKAPPIRWYEADHNETMFTNYAKDAPHAVHQLPTDTASGDAAGAVGGPADTGASGPAVQDTTEDDT